MSFSLVALLACNGPTDTGPVPSSEADADTDADTDTDTDADTDTDTDTDSDPPEPLHADTIQVGLVANFVDGQPTPSVIHSYSFPPTFYAALYNWDERQGGGAVRQCEVFWDLEGKPLDNEELDYWVHWDLAAIPPTQVAGCDEVTTLFGEPTDSIAKAVQDSGLELAIGDIELLDAELAKVWPKSWDGSSYRTTWGDWKQARPGMARLAIGLSFLEMSEVAVVLGFQIDPETGQPLQDDKGAELPLSLEAQKSLPDGYYDAIGMRVVGTGF